MKNNKSKTIITVSILIIILLGIVSTFYILKKDDNSFTLQENKWIDSNKYNVIDIAILNDIPILSYSGDGIVYKYLDYMTDNYSLKFNVVPYKLDGTSAYDYKMDLVNAPKNNDIVLFNDNLVLITNSNIQYKHIDDIENLKLGVISSDLNLLSNYLKNNNVEFVEYSNYSELKNSILNSRTDLESTFIQPAVDGIIIPKLVFTQEIIEKDYIISFDFNDLNKYFVITSEDNSELKSILNKVFKKWKNLNYQDEYNKQLLKNFFSLKNISDVEQKKLQSKSYKYGFINYGIFNYLDNNKIDGMSSLILKNFNKFSGLSITYTQYNSISKVLKDFNDNKIDFVLNLASDKNYSNNIYNTVGVFDENLVIISGIDNTETITSINSLNNKTVSVIKDFYLSDYLIENGAIVKAYNNMKDLTNDFSKSDIAIVDLENYNFYKTSAFKDTKINYIIYSQNKYSFVVNDSDENKVFEQLFNFYLSYICVNKLISSNYESIAYNNFDIKYILIIVIIILSIYVILDFSSHIKTMLKTIKKNKKIKLSKEDKIKYIDQLTSLKNRAYLNSRIESWDESEIYPQAIIVVDLNHISYINDNYGREEGDKVITDAANVLILNQLHNSEIIRTDGNEFLIYLVGYNEKQIVSYLRKLNREFKKLSHGFGAASGYSIITDAIKTFDDAVNEATLEMKNNKEDIEY